jgi:S1-C subfamily serine protease
LVAKGCARGSNAAMHKSAFALVATAFVLLPHAAVLGQGLPQAVRPQAAEAAVTVDPALRKSVIKIAVKQEMRDPSTPWKRESPEDFGGSGVVIAPGRVLTNAHVVEQTSEIMLETDQTALPVQAELLAIDRTRDLALLEVKDEAFNRDHPPIPLFEGLPKEGSRVTVMGFPMGGDALSTTSGVISRIEWAEIGQGGEDGMRVQVDAAINFGNSGGPAFVDGKVAGLAFSGLMGSADNISYLLATEEIVRFLDEAAAGRVDGNTVLNLEVQTLENPALRAKLGASGDVAGVVVIDQKGGPLQAWDIIVKINGQAVDNKGQVTIEGDRKVAMDCVVGRFVPTAEKPNHVVEILREGKPMTFELPAYTRANRVIRDYADGNYPYLVYGPLVFSPLHRDLLSSAGRWMIFRQSPITPYIFDDRPSDGREFVSVVCPLLSSPVARGYEVMPGQSVKSVNGKTFKNFREFVQLLRDTKDEFVVFEFNELGTERIVLRTAEIEEATEKLLDSNGIRRQCSKDVRDIWDKD